MRDFTICDAPQRSLEWRRARAGRLTASCAKHVLATVKTGEAAARRDLRLRLVLERITGEPQEDDYQNADMARGIELESEAFRVFEAVTGQMAARCGFVAHTDLQIGCSPDGVLDDFAGILELKVPRSATHLSYLRAGTVPSEHRAQLLHALWVTGADYCDFLSYDPRFPEGMQAFYVRVERDAAELAAYETKALTFLAEVQAEVLALRTMANPVAQMKAVIA